MHLVLGDRHTVQAGKSGDLLPSLLTQDAGGGILYGGDHVGREKTATAHEAPAAGMGRRRDGERSARILDAPAR